MAYYGRYRRRRYPYRRRYRNYNRRRYTRSRYTRYKKSPYNRVFMAKRLGYPTVETVSQDDYTQILNNGDTQYLKFSLWNVVQQSDFTGLYNEFKIRAVKVSFIPLANVSNMEQSAYSNLIYSAIDVNGGIDSLSRDAIRQYQTVKWTPYNRIHSRYFYPRNPIGDDDPDRSSSVVLPGKQPWISTVNPQYRVNHYGLYISPPVIEGIDPTEPIYQVECTYYLSFRGTK